MDLGFITCDDIGKLLFVIFWKLLFVIFWKLLFVIFWKHLKQLFGHFRPLPLFFSSVNRCGTHLAEIFLTFKCFFKLRRTVDSDMPIFRAISRTVILVSPAMISFILETISLRDADFGLPEFGAFLWTLHQTHISFSTAELCHKIHKKVHKQ